MTTIKITRTCPANKIVSGDATPVYGPKAGTLFTGILLRPDGHPHNNQHSYGCVELVMADGTTWAFPADCVEVIN